jgi:hypothetical protein
MPDGGQCVMDYLDILDLKAKKLRAQAAHFSEAAKRLIDDARALEDRAAEIRISVERFMEAG